jgi:hypothetical protein
VRVLAGDIALPRYALTRAQWLWLAHNIDVVVHNGAVVNAVLPYESLRDANVGGTRDGAGAVRHGVAEAARLRVDAVDSRERAVAAPPTPRCRRGSAPRSTATR